MAWEEMLAYIKETKSKRQESEPEPEDTATATATAPIVGGAFLTEQGNINLEST